MVSQSTQADPQTVPAPARRQPGPARGIADLLADIAPQLGSTDTRPRDDAPQDALPSVSIDPALRPRRSNPRTVIGELLLAYGAVLGLELLICDGTLGGADLAYHPYWLVILPMAAARGLGSGLAAAAVGGALLVIASILRGLADSPAEALSLDSMSTGAGFLLVAFVLGWLRDEIREQHVSLWNRHLDLAAAHELTMRIEEQLLSSNRRLKLRLLDQTAQFGSLIDAARTLRDTDEERALDLLLQLVQEQCGAAACSVLRVRPDQTLALGRSRGWTAGDETRRLLAAERSPLVQRARVGAGQAVDAFAPGAHDPGGGPLVVTPLNTARGRVTALLCIDELPPHRFTTATTSLLAAIAEWSSDTGRHTSGFASFAVDERLGTPGELAVRIKGEVGRVALTGEVASVLVIRVQGDEEAERETAAVLLPELLHSSDGIYVTGVDQALAIVLPATTLHAARQAGRRLAARLQSARPPHVRSAEFTVVQLPASLHDVDAAFVAMEAMLGAPLPEGLADTADQAQGLAEFVRDLRAEAELATRTGQEVWLALVHTAPEYAEALDEALAATATNLEPPAVAYRLGNGRALVLLPAVRGDEAFAIGHALTHEARARGAAPDRTYSEVLALGDDGEETCALLDRLTATRAPDPDADEGIAW